MDKTGLVILAILLFLYALGVTIALIVTVMSNLTKSRNLRLMQQELDALKAQKGAVKTQPAAAQPSVQKEAPVQAPVNPAVQPRPVQAPASPAVSQAPAAQYRYEYTTPLTKEQARAAASARPAIQTAASAPVTKATAPSTVQSSQNAPAVSTPAAVTPAAPAKQVKQREKIKFSSINISFAVGVLLITIVGAVFISSSWNFMNDALRATVLIGVVALVFFLSYLSGHILKLKQTGFAFYTLGSLLVPVVTTGIGAMGLFGDWFSFEGDGAALVAACAAALFGVAGYIGVRIYKSGAYYGIMYLGFTWTVLFIAAQFGFKPMERMQCSYVALNAVALAASLLVKHPKSSDFRFFKLYSEIVSYIALGMTIFILWEKNVAVIIGLVLLCAVLYVRGILLKKVWHLYVLPFISEILAIYSTVFVDINSEISEFVVFGSVIVAFYLILEFLKGRTVASDIIYPLALFVCALGGRIQYIDCEPYSLFYITLALFAVSFAMAVWGAYRKTNNKAVRTILAVVSSGISLFCVYSPASMAFSFIKDKQLNWTRYICCYAGEFMSFESSRDAALIVTFLSALAAYIFISVNWQNKFFAKFIGYSYLFGSAVCSIAYQDFGLFYLALAAAVLVSSITLVGRKPEEKKTGLRIFADIILYGSLVLMIGALFISADYPVIAGILAILFALGIRGKAGIPRFHRYLIPVFSCMLGFCVSYVFNLYCTFNTDIFETIIYATVIILCWIALEITRQRSYFSDIFMPMSLCFGLLDGPLSYAPYRTGSFFVSLSMVVICFILLLWSALRKESNKGFRAASSILGAAMSLQAIWSLGTFIFGYSIVKDLPKIAGTSMSGSWYEIWRPYIDMVSEQAMLMTAIVALVLYIVCSSVMRRFLIARSASYSYYAIGLLLAFVLIPAYTEGNMSIAVASIILMYALAAIVSRYISRPESHPDIRAAIALVFSIAAGAFLFNRIFEQEIGNIVILSVMIVLTAITLIPQIRDHKVISRYTEILNIAAAVVGMAGFVEVKLFEDYPVIPLALAILMLVIMYLRSNTVIAVLYILICEKYIADLLHPYDGYYVFICITGVLMLVLGYILHRKGLYRPVLYIDYLTFLAILFPLNAFYGALGCENFAILITLALILASIALRYPKASRVLYSVSLSAAFIAVLTLQIVKDLPDEIKGEVIMVLLLADVFIIRSLIKPGSESTMRIFWIISVAVCLVIEGLSAAVTGEILDLLVTGIVSVAIFIYAFIAKDKSWFLLSIIAIIGIAVYLSATFWASKAWLVYLLVVGIILISMAAINEYGKRKAELKGEETGSAGSGVKRFFEEWKW